MAIKAKRVKMSETAQAVADARDVLARGLGYGTAPEVEAAVFALVLREFLDNEYDRDMPEGWRPDTGSLRQVR